MIAATISKPRNPKMRPMRVLQLHCNLRTDGLQVTGVLELQGGQGSGDAAALHGVHSFNFGAETFGDEVPFQFAIGGQKATLNREWLRNYAESADLFVVRQS